MHWNAAGGGRRREGVARPKPSPSGRVLTGSAVVGFGFSEDSILTVKETHHEHPREAYQGPAGDASPGRGITEHQPGVQARRDQPQPLYEIKEAFEKYGAEGLAPRTRRRPRMPNQTPPELEQKILEMTERYPTFSYLRISPQLRLVGVGVSPSAVRYAWQRHGLTLRYQRLLWLEQKTAARGGVLTESQLRLLRRHRGKLTDPEQHVEAPQPGYLLCQDTYFVGSIKGVGKIYMQSVVDAHCSLGFAKLYLSKLPMTAVDVLHDRVLPFYEEHPVEVQHLLTDNGREFCGRAVHHPFELFLAISQIEHRRTDVASPETNGFCENGSAAP